ncbi:hypothetical protein NL676_005725 [Syzygium grande]|nr:hypothetical protein NL676_005725 [Syzygium grande]
MQSSEFKTGTNTTNIDPRHQLAIEFLRFSRTTLPIGDGCERLVRKIYLGTWTACSTTDPAAAAAAAAERCGERAYLDVTAAAIAMDCAKSVSWRNYLHCCNISVTERDAREAKRGGNRREILQRGNAVSQMHAGKAQKA